MSGFPLEDTVYLTVHPDRRSTWSTRGLTVVRAASSRPADVPSGCIVVAVRLRIPREAFEPLRPQVVVDIPTDLVQRPVEATAVDAND